METDNEFDEMFRSELKDFEAEPSAGVWLGIEGSLNAQRGKRSIIPFIGIAASLLILLSAGLLFIRHHPKTGEKNLNKNKSSIANQPINTPVAVENMEQQVIKLNTGKIAPQQTIAVNNVKEQRSAGYKTNKEKKQGPIDTNPPLAVATLQNNQGTINPSVIIREVPAPVEQPADENINIKPILAAVTLPAADQPAAEAVRPKHKIKSFGDLVNVVVGKVDKRKDKLIEFTDTDDDESTITGINLGVLKIKKEK